MCRELSRGGGGGGVPALKCVCVARQSGGATEMHRSDLFMLLSLLIAAVIICFFGAFNAWDASLYGIYLG